MKKTILFLITLLLTCKLGNAQDVACCDCACRVDFIDPFYFEIFGGANFLQTEKNGGIKTDYQTGYVVSGSVGYRWRYGLRLEAEYAYRRNSLRRIHFFGRGFRIHGHFQSSSYMANLLWDIWLSNWGLENWKIKPFIGGGIGYDHQQISAHHSALAFKKNKKHFSWQIIAGLGYPLFCNTDISVEYKFHKGGFSHFYSHSVGAGLTYHFGL
jgi:opacity protein-like surface antigen